MAVVQAEQPTPTADGAKAISLIGRWLRQALYALLAGAPVRPFSLTFESPELEARFRHEHFVGYLPVMRLALALGLLLYPSYAIIDLFDDGSATNQLIDYGWKSAATS